MLRNGFDSDAAYRVCTWRGFEHGSRQYRLGDVVTTAEIDASTLFTLHRFRFVEKVQSAPVAKSRTFVDRLAGMSAKDLKSLCKARGLNDRGSEAELRDRLRSAVA